MNMSAGNVDELFALNIVADDPRFEGFAMEDAPSLLGRASLDDDLSPGFEITPTTRLWQVPRLAKLWKPLRVKGRVQPYQDFPGVNLVYPAFSKRACDALRDMLEPNGELLPLNSDCGEYYFYNIATVIDALDVANSKCFFFSERPSLAVRIDSFAFHEEKLAGGTIFRIVEWPIKTIVSNHFVDRVRDCGLNGFNFRKIWPLPKGVNWRLEDKRVKVAKPEHRDVLALKQQTVVLQLLLTGQKPNTAEKSHIKRIEDDLDAQLAVKSLDEPFFGVYEGSDIANGEFRVFLCCPDANRLVQKLDPWLRRIGWKSGLRVFKRFGDLRDVNAPEEAFELP